MTIDQSKIAPYGSLIVVFPDGRETVVSLVNPTVRIGQAADNDLVLPVAVVAPYHTLLLCSQAGIDVIDLGSSAGTLLDGQRLPADQPFRAPEDAVIQIGPVRLFVYPGESTVTATETVRTLFGTAVVVDSSGRPQLLPLHAPLLRIGSALDNDILLPDSSARPYQAQIVTTDQGFALIDLISGDRTPLTGWKPVGPLRIAVFEPHDEIGLHQALSGLSPAAPADAAPRVVDGPAAAQFAPAVGSGVSASQSPAGSSSAPPAVPPASADDLRSGQANAAPGVVDGPAAAQSVPAVEHGASASQSPAGSSSAPPAVPPASADDQRSGQANAAGASAQTKPLKSSADDAAKPKTGLDAIFAAQPAHAEDDDMILSSEVEALLHDAAVYDPAEEAGTIERDDEDAVEGAVSAATPPLPVPTPAAPTVSPGEHPLLGTLVVVLPSGKRYVAYLRKPTIRVGRAQDNDVILDDPSVADHHIQIFCAPPDYQVFDLGASVRTFIDDRAISSYVPVGLNRDSVIKLGQLRMFIYPPDEPVAPLETLPSGQPMALATASQLPVPAEPSGPLTQSMNIRLSQRALRVQPGQSVALKATLINHSSVLDHLIVSVEGLPSGWVAISNPELPLFPGARGEVEIKLSPPREAAASVGDYPCTVVVTSEHDAAAQMRASAVLHVLPFYDVDVSIFPPRQSGRASGDFQVEIANRSNQRLMLTLHFLDSEQAFDIPFVDRQVWIDAGAVYQAPLKLRLRRRRWWGRSDMHPFTLSAKLPDQSVEQASAEFLAVPLLHREEPEPPPKALPAPRSAPARPLRTPPPAIITPRVERPAPARPAPAAAETVVLTPAPEPPQPAVTQDDGFEPIFVALTNSMLSTEAGGAATTTISIQNRSNIVDRIKLEISGVPNQWAVLTPDALSLLPNARSEAQLILSPPRSSQSSAGPNRFRILARSEKRPDQPSLLSGVLDIRPFTEFRLNMFPLDRTVRRQGRFTLEIVNRSNQPQTFELSARDNEELVRFTFVPGIVTVAPGATQVVRLVARLEKRRWAGQSQMYPFTVNVMPEQNEELAQQLQARISDRPLIPGWMVQVLVPLFAIVVAVALITSRQQIGTFVRNLFSGKLSFSSSSSPTAVVNTAATDASAPTTVVVPAGSGATTPATGTVSLIGENRWTLADSPVFIDATYVVSPDATLAIESGVEVRFSPGASLQVLGALEVAGVDGAPVRFMGTSSAAWGELDIIRGGQASIDHLLIEGAGSETRAILVQSGTLAMRNSSITASKGGILIYNGAVTLSNLTMQRNTLGSTPAIGVELLRGNSFSLDTATISANQMAATAATIHVLVQQIETQVTIKNTLIVQPDQLGLVLQAVETFQASVTCNTIQTKQAALAAQLNGLAPQLDIANNSLGQVGGNGALSDTALTLDDNYWGDAGGPSGSALSGAGSRLLGSAQTTSWLRSPPPCAPTQ